MIEWHSQFSHIDWKSLTKWWREKEIFFSMWIMPDHIQCTGSRANQEFKAHYQNPFSEENIPVDGGENSAIKIKQRRSLS